MIFEFKLHDKVTVLPLMAPGRVLAIYVTMEGVQYSVRYFFNGEAKTEYFFVDELEHAV